MSIYKNKKLAILGASKFQKPSILKAKSLGLETHVFSWLSSSESKKYADYFYPISIDKKNDILAISSKIGIHGIVSPAVDLGTETSAFVSQQLGLNSNSYETVLIARDKNKFREHLREKKLSAIEYLEFSADDSMEMLKDFLKKQKNIVIKPKSMSGSKGVHFVSLHDLNKLSEILDYTFSCSSSGNILAEQYIGGKEYSVEILSYKGIHKVFAITEKETTPIPYFVEVYQGINFNLSLELREKINHYSMLVLEAIGVTDGLSHLEIKVDGDNIEAIEIGLRMGGDFIGSHLVELATGFDYVKADIDIALNCFAFDNLDYPVKRESHAQFISLPFEKNAALHHKEQVGLISAIEIHKDFENGFNTLTRSSSDRPGYIIYTGKKMNQSSFEDTMGIVIKNEG